MKIIYGNERTLLDGWYPGFSESALYLTVDRISAMPDEYPGFKWKTTVELCLVLFSYLRYYAFY